MAASDIGGDWDVGDSKDIDLRELFANVPDNALLVRKMTRTGLNAWQWFITGVAVLYLVYLVIRVAAWAFGSRPSQNAPQQTDLPDAATGTAAPPE